MSNIEQEVYKILKCLTKDTYLTEISKNKFISTYNFNLGVPAHDDANLDAKETIIDFNTKTACWKTREYDYNSGRHYDRGGDLNWEEFLTIIQPYIKNILKQNLTYKFLQEEAKRTEKIRELKIKCMMNIKLNAIEDLVL